MVYVNKFALYLVGLNAGSTVMWLCQVLGKGGMLQVNCADF